jgi:hypothetical protein
MAERLAEIEGKARAAEDAQRRATEEAAMAKLSSKGEFEEALKRTKEEHATQMESAFRRVRDSTLRAVISKAPGLMPSAIDDVAFQLSSGCKYDPATESLVFKDAAGRPILGNDGRPATVETVLESFLSNRPHFRQAAGSAGSGAGGNTGNTSIPTIYRKDLASMTPDQATLFAAGKIKLID